MDMLAGIGLILLIIGALLIVACLRRAFRIGPVADLVESAVIGLIFGAAIGGAGILLLVIRLIIVLLFGS